MLNNKQKQEARDIILGQILLGCIWMLIFIVCKVTFFSTLSWWIVLLPLVLLVLMNIMVLLLYVFVFLIGLFYTVAIKTNNKS